MERTSQAALFALAGIGISVGFHQIALAAAIPLASGALAAFCLPDDPVARAALQKLAADAATAEASHTLTAAVPVLVTDAETLQKAVETSAAIPTVEKK